jgi:hypothetical protein
VSVASGGAAGGYEGFEDGYELLAALALKGIENEVNKLVRPIGHAEHVSGSGSIRINVTDVEDRPRSTARGLDESLARVPPTFALLVGDHDVKPIALQTPESFSVGCDLLDPSSERRQEGDLLSVVLWLIIDPEDPGPFEKVRRPLKPPNDPVLVLLTDGDLLLSCRFRDPLAESQLEPERQLETAEPGDEVVPDRPVEDRQNDDGEENPKDAWNKTNRFFCSVGEHT